MMENDGKEKVSFLPLMLPLSHSLFGNNNNRNIVNREKQQAAKGKLMDKIILHFFFFILKNWNKFKKFLLLLNMFLLLRWEINTLSEDETFFLKLKLFISQKKKL